jgi:hypothetical protein
VQTIERVSFQNGEENKNEVFLQGQAGVGREEFGGSVRPRQLQTVNEIQAKRRIRPQSTLRLGLQNVRVRTVAEDNVEGGDVASVLRQDLGAPSVGRARRRWGREKG